MMAITQTFQVASCQLGPLIDQEQTFYKGCTNHVSYMDNDLIQLVKEPYKPLPFVKYPRQTVSS